MVVDLINFCDRGSSLAFAEIIIVKPSLCTDQHGRALASSHVQASYPTLQLELWVFFDSDINLYAIWITFSNFSPQQRKHLPPILKSLTCNMSRQ